MKKTLSVGIPAYNEADNLPYLLHTIQNQSQDKYVLEKIIIVSDGSNDGTEELMTKFCKQDKRIEFIQRNERKGKAHALNLIYSLNTSELLFVPDADVVLENNHVLNELVICYEENKGANLISARHIPAASNSLMGKFAIYSYLSLEDAFMKYKDGNNFYSVMSASMITNEFAHTFRYPEGTLSDQCFLYAKATRDVHNGYRFAKKARVVFRTVTTFHDWRLLGQRSVIGDKADVAKHFGKDILKEYSLPKSLIVSSLLKYLILHPVYTGGSILMNVFIRFFPYQKHKPHGGMWETSKSSKMGIIL